ncbi:MAG: restriction endonuclease subunit S [Gammaproteobacteria bacterium]|nr:restriction endonuclease subunit S [Gammaproteobacteria bacterium]
MNAVGRVPVELDGATASTGFCVLRPRSKVADGAYLLHWVRSPGFVGEMVRRAKGASYPAVSDRIVRESKIPLPSLDEQKRIAGILDAADALRAKRREALDQLDTLLQSTFLDMFGDPVTNPMSWPEVALGAHTSKIGSGATPLGGEAAYKKDGIALIRSKNVHDGHFSQHGLAFIDDQQAARLDGVVVELDDVLLNITGASVARVCRAPHCVLPARVNQHVAIIRSTNGFDQRFLEQCLLFPSMKRWLLRIAGAGATREAITKDAIKRLMVIQPPRNEQDRIAAIVQSVERQKAHQRAHLAELDTLFASLQSRAFRGDL